MFVTGTDEHEAEALLAPTRISPRSETVAVSSQTHPRRHDQVSTVNALEGQAILQVDAAPHADCRRALTSGRVTATRTLRATSGLVALAPAAAGHAGGRGTTLAATRSTAQRRYDRFPRESSNKLAPANVCAETGRPAPHVGTRARVHSAEQCRFFALDIFTRGSTLSRLPRYDTAQGCARVPCDACAAQQRQRATRDPQPQAKRGGRGPPAGGSGSNSAAAQSPPPKLTTVGTRQYLAISLHTCTKNLARAAAYPTIAPPPFARSHTINPASAVHPPPLSPSPPLPLSPPPASRSSTLQL